jgi:hypothetical protein
MRKWDEHANYAAGALRASVARIGRELEPVFASHTLPSEHN